MSLTAYRNALSDAQARKRAAAASLADARRAYVAAADGAVWAAEAQTLVQGIAAGVQAAVHARIAALVGRCLAAVFDEPYEFTITFEQRRGRTEAVIGLQRGTLVVDPLEAAGGGVCDVTAFALRLAALIMARPAKRRLLVMDEPFRFVSAEYRPAIRRLIEGLSQEFGIQFIFVTHDPALQIGHVVEFR